MVLYTTDNDSAPIKNTAENKEEKKTVLYSLLSKTKILMLMS